MMMLPRKYVTAMAATTASSSQAGARISPEGAHHCNPKRPPTSHHQARRSSPTDIPCRSQLCTTRPSTPTLHRTATGTSRAAACRVAPKPSPPASLNRRPHGRFKPTSPPNEAAAPAPGSHNGQRPVSSHKHARGRRPKPLLPGVPPAKPIGPPGPSSRHGRASTSCRTTPRRRSPSSTSPPAPTGAARAAATPSAARAAATPSAAAANLGPPPPDADAPPRHDTSILHHYFVS
jgi:hypothetical protein